MERVTGIGGLFFRSHDPAGLTRWYADHLGVAPPPETYGESSWRQEAGPTVVAPMSPDSGHLADAEHRWAVNFRVRDLDAMVRQLAAAGLAVAVDPESYPNGRFADLSDPEGNRIQLWEPAGADRVE